MPEKHYQINVEDTNALATFGNDILKPRELADLTAFAQQKIVTTAADWLRSAKPVRGITWVEARRFGASAWLRADRLQQYVAHVANGINSMAYTVRSIHNTYQEADLKAEKALQDAFIDHMDGKIVEEDLYDRVATPGKPNETFATHGWWTGKSLDLTNGTYGAHTGAFIDTTQSMEGPPEYYSSSEQRRPGEQTEDKPTGGATDWRQGDLADGQIFLRFVEVVKAEPIAPLEVLQVELNAVSDDISRLESQVREHTENLATGWDGRAASLFSVRATQSLRSMSHWAQWSRFNAELFGAMAVGLRGVVKQLDRAHSTYMATVSDPAKAPFQTFRGPTVDPLRSYKQFYDKWALEFAAALSRFFDTSTQWTTLPKYPGLLNVPSVAPVIPQVAPPTGPGGPGAGPGGTPSGGPGGGPGGVPGGLPGGGGGPGAAPNADAIKRAQEDLRKRDEAARKQIEAETKKFNQQVKERDDELKKQQDALNKQAAEQNAPPKPPEVPDPQAQQQQLDDLQRRIDESIAQLPPIPNPTDLTQPGTPYLPPVGGLGLLPTAIGAVGASGVAGGGSGGGGAPRIPTGLPTAGAVDLMGRGGTAATTTGLGGAALIGRGATPAAPGGIPFMPPMGGTGGGGGAPASALSGRRGRPVLPDEATKPAPRPRIVDPQGDGNTASRGARDNDRRATVAEPSKAPEVEGGQALGRTAV